MFGNLVLAASDLADNTASNTGLSGAWKDIVDKWVGPIVFIILGCFSLKFLISREWSKLISFLALGVVVAVVIYVAPHMFGQNSGLVQDVGKVAEKAGNVSN